MYEASMFADGDLVMYDNGAVKGIGTIVGMASIPVAYVGATWIIHTPTIRSVIYDFEYIVMSSIHLKRV